MALCSSAWHGVAVSGSECLAWMSCLGGLSQLSGDLQAGKVLGYILA